MYRTEDSSLACGAGSRHQSSGDRLHATQLADKNCLEKGPSGEPVTETREGSGLAAKRDGVRVDRKV
ncbi:unnamed protein product [Boreogadus saida]